LRRRGRRHRALPASYERLCKAGRESWRSWSRADDEDGEPDCRWWRPPGLDLAQTRELLAGGAAGSWAFDNYGPKILVEDWSPGFSIKNQRKDFSYCLSAAADVHAFLPGTEIVDALLEQLEEEGHGEWTTAALYKLLLETEVVE
jgi:hypothetical protein